LPGMGLANRPAYSTFSLTNPIAPIGLLLP